MLRTHEAGTLRAAHTGQTVTLTGWVAKRRDHGGVAFLDVRDGSGVVQVVARDEVLTGAAHDLRNEFVVKVVGPVSAREERNVNPDLATGEVEVLATSIEVLNTAAQLPFQVDERVTVIRPGRVGRGPALNIGLKAARGDLIGIQDADDASHVDRLMCQSALFAADPDLALLGTVGGKTPAPTLANPKAAAKAEVVAALQASFDYGAAVIKEFNDQQLIERVASMPFLGPTASRLKVIYFSMQHTQDIYGQLVVYLRLNGITPPASNRGV